MRLLKLFSLLSFISLAFQSCQSSSSNTIKGTLENASNIQIFLDKLSVASANLVVAKGDIGSNGEFTLSSETPLEAGLYRLRVGAKNLILVLDGKQSAVKITGNLNDIDLYNVKIEGSKSSEDFANVMRRIINRELNVNDAKAAIENTEDPLTAMALAFLVFGRNHEFLDAHQKIQANFAKAYAGSPYVDEYNNFIMAMQSEKMLSQQSGPVQVGQPAPEISLPNPDGKSMSLSDLKGKVVLLDFWASWCGPCRRENPNVVRVYDKYKSKGFEVFSVSLDRPNGKEKWVEAIKADNLKWKYHVSDLQFWNSAPARLYGVNSIPRTFLIDKDGNIAALNLRGAESIEAELQKLL